MPTTLDLSSEVPAPERTSPAGRVIRVGKRMRVHMSADIQRLGLTTIALASSGSTTLLFNLVCVRVLSPGAYGSVARTFSLGMAVAQLTMAGLAPAIARHVAHGDGDEHRFSRGRGGIRVLCLSTAAVSLLYLPLAFGGLAPTSSLSLLLGTALAFIYATYFGLKFMLFALDWSTRYAALEFLSDAIFFLTLALLAVLAPNAAVLTFSVAYAVFIIVAVRLISRRGSGIERIQVNRGLATYTGWASIATYASIGRFTVAVAVTGAIAGSVSAGRVAAILAIIMPLFLIPQAAGVLTFADVARASGGDAGGPVRLMCRISALVSAATIITCCLFGHEVIRILLGARYDSTTGDFLILMLCVAPQIVSIPIGNALAAQGAVVLNATLSVAAFIVMLIGLILLVPAHGVLGAVIAFGVSMLATGVSMLVVGRIRFNLGLGDIGGMLLGVGLGLVAIAFDGAPIAARVAVELLLLTSAAGLAALALRRNERPLMVGG
jgi:O-antigen/teichoic acid export membrane protein